MEPPRDLAIRPLGLGEVIDRSIAVTLRHLKPLFAAMLLVEAPALALARLQQARSVELLAVLADPARAAALLPGVARSLAWLVGTLLLLQSIATAAAAVIVAPSLDPRPAGAGGPSLARRAVSAVTASVVQGIALVGAPALGAAPGALLAIRAESLATQLVGIAAALLGAAALFLTALLRLVLAPAVAAVEGRGGLAAIIRSARLMGPRRGGRVLDRPGLRASLVLFATFLLALAVNGLAGLPRVVAARTVGQAGPLGFLDAALPLPIEVVVTMLEAAASAALQPFSLAAVVVLYFDRRARAEALDVEIWAARIEAER